MRNRFVSLTTPLLAAAMLGACGGGGGNGDKNGDDDDGTPPPEPRSFNVAGTVTGLNASGLILTFNGTPVAVASGARIVQ